MKKSKKHTYTIDFVAVDAKGRDWGRQTISGTLSRVCAELADIAAACAFDFGFRVKRNGRHSDCEDFTFAYLKTGYSCLYDCPIDYYELYPTERVNKIKSLSWRAEWRQAFADEINRQVRRYDTELLGYFF